MVAGYFDATPVQGVGERLRGPIVPILRAGQDEDRYRDRRQFLRSGVHPRIQGEQQRLRVAAVGQEPVLRLLLVAARLENAGSARGEELPVPAGVLRRVQQRVEPVPADDRPARRRTPGEHAYHGPPAERMPGQVVVGNPQVVDQRQPVVGEDIRWIRSGVVRLGAVPVRPQIRHDHPVPAPGQAPGQPRTAPVCPPVLMSVNEDERPTMPSLLVSQSQPVPAVKVHESHDAEADWPGKRLPLTASMARRCCARRPASANDGTLMLSPQQRRANDAVPPGPANDNNEPPMLLPATTRATTPRLTPEAVIWGVLRWPSPPQVRQT